MGITYISGLLSLFGLFVVVILYMLRPKKELVEIPSTYLWKQISDELTNARKIERVRKTILFFIDVMIAILITLFLLGIFVQGEKLNMDTVILIDSGFTMNSTDVSPSRLDKAKKLASDYVDRLEDGVKVSLVSVGKNIKPLYSKESDKAVIKSAISAIPTSYQRTDKTAVEDYIASVKTNQNVKVVYFGDQEINADELVNVSVNNDNVSLVNFKVKKTDTSVDGAAVIRNDGKEELDVEVSLYEDGLYFATESVRIKASSVGSVIFSGLNKSARVYKAVIENDDINTYDNTYYDIGLDSEVKKVALITSGNYFVEKFLGLRSDIELAKTTPEDYVKLTGYDLYIFDSFVPETMVTDGSVLILDPPNVKGYEKLGDIKSPDVKVEEHFVNRFIDKKKPNIAKSKVYERKPAYEAIYSIKEGLLAYSTREGSREKIVFGFDFRYTDMPLDSSFPILMNNVVSYLIQNKVTNKYRYSSEDVVEISLPVETIRASMTKPDKQVYDISAEKEVVYYMDTRDLGVYKIEAVSNEDESEYMTSYYFVVNPPSELSESETDSNQLGETSNLDVYTLNDYIGMAILLLLLIELFIRSTKTKKKILAGKKSN